MDCQEAEVGVLLYSMSSEVDYYKAELDSE